MASRILSATTLLLGLSMSVANAQDRTATTSEPKAKPATLEQRIAALEEQAAKLQKEAQALREALKALKPSVDEDITIYRLKNANAVSLAKLLGELFHGPSNKSLRILADPETNSLLIRADDVERRKIETIVIRLDEAAANSTAKPRTP
jgi:type II secretory pathway component GspD/PulD (secretin)